MGAQPKHIVVLGAGFGGTYTFKELYRRFHQDRGISLTLINRTSYFLFTPLLHEVATGGVSPENVVEPLRKIFRCGAHNLFVGEVEKIHTAKKCVATTIGTLAYDYLVIALGSRTNFFDIPGAERHAFTLKSLDDAIRLKAHIVRTFERAVHCTDPFERRRLLTFVIVGGGATGVELAAELAEYRTDTFEHYYAGASCMKEVRIILVHRETELIPQFSPSLRQRAADFLKKKNIELRFQRSVTRVEAESIHLDNGEEIPTATPIWVAGVTPHMTTCDTRLAQQGGRYATRSTLQLLDHDQIFAIGDNACVMQDGVPIPMLAQVAAKQSCVVADNIAAHLNAQPLKKFTYRSSGNLLSIGQWMAIAEIGRFTFWGHLAWFLWRTVYLSKLISWDHKIKVVVDWILNIFSRRTISDV